MMTDDIVKCPKCGFTSALTHYSSCDQVRWVACPKCKTFFDHDVETSPTDNPEDEDEFWAHVRQDVGMEP
jgi:RNA polymerase subunit RPABC4/transcription elongation factor Spt4